MLRNTAPALTHSSGGPWPLGKGDVLQLALLPSLFMIVYRKDQENISSLMLRL